MKKSVAVSIALLGVIILTASNVESSVWYIAHAQENPDWDYDVAANAPVVPTPSISQNLPHSGMSAQEYELRMKVREIAKFEGIEAKEIENIIECETGGTWDTKIQSNYLKGTPRRELSFGLAQIHVSAHKGITREMASDPDFAIRFLVYHWKQGHRSMWLNCSKKYGYL